MKNSYVIFCLCFFWCGGSFTVDAQGDETTGPIVRVHDVVYVPVDVFGVLEVSIADIDAGTSDASGELLLSLDDFYLEETKRIQKKDLMVHKGQSYTYVYLWAVNVYSEQAVGQTKVIAIDTTPPQVVAQSVLSIQDSLVVITAQQLDVGSFDNWDRQRHLSFSFSEDVGDTRRVVDMREEGTFLTLWATDRAGNQSASKEGTCILFKE